jgi:hypothetical protein
LDPAKFWLGVMNELNHRGLKDILVAVIDGLKGFPEAISAVYPDSEIQTCIVALWSEPFAGGARRHGGANQFIHPSMAYGAYLSIMPVLRCSVSRALPAQKPYLAANENSTDIKRHAKRK